nr:hypothetical protein [uncultured Pseudodesulfovibrio sp.]
MKKILTDFVKRHPVFSISLPIWVLIWMFFIAPLPTAAFYVVLPMGAIIMFFSLFFFGSNTLRPVAVFVWTGPVALLLIGTVASVLGVTFAATDTYYIGVDVNTPSGLKSYKSMIQLDDTSFNIWPLNPYVRQPKVKGEAVFCDLGERKNLVLLLSFQGDHYGLDTLKSLPWSAAGHMVNYQEKSQPFISGRYPLTGDLTPILVTFPDTANRDSMKAVSPDSIITTYGEGYSIHRIWVEMTVAPYESGQIEHHLPWLKDRRVKRQFIRD